MLMWRSGSSVVHAAPSIAAVQFIVLAVGRLRPPFADDVQHYQRLLARHARVELIEVREDEQVAAPDPGARVRVAARRRRARSTTRRRSRAGWRSAARAGATSASWSAARSGRELDARRPPPLARAR